MSSSPSKLSDKDNADDKPEPDQENTAKPKRSKRASTPGKAEKSTAPTGQSATEAKHRTPKTKQPAKADKGGKTATRSKTPKVASASAPASAATEPSKVHQDRVGSGKGWRYQVLPNQKYGCANCRFIFNGCASCKKASFRGKSAAQLRAEEEASQAAPEVKGSSNNKAPKRKAKKSKGKSTDVN